MKFTKNRFKNNGLFVKMFVIMVVSIVAVSILTTWTTINLSGRVFMETFSITNSKVIQQIQTRMDLFNYSIVTTTNKIAQSGTIKLFLSQGEGSSNELYKSYYAMSQQMNRIRLSVDAYELGITVTGTNGRSYSTDRSNWPVTDAVLKQHPITKRSLAEPRKLMYQYDDAERSGLSTVSPTIIATKALTDRSGTVYGMVYFALRETYFAKFYDSNTSPGNDIAIMDSQGTIISSNREDWIGQQSSDLLHYAQAIEEQDLAYKNADIMGKDQIILSEYLGSLNLYMVNLIDKQTVTSQFIDTKRIAIIVMGIVAAAVLIVFIISRRMTKSLSRLVKQISTISKYEFDRYVTVGGSYETRQLGLAFNEMIDELNDYVGRLVDTERQRRNAELEALQQQINPHFLYNTLASVKFMVQQGSKEKAAETINALISLLHNAIGTVGEMITVRQELDNMKNYVYINHIRYGERIRVSYFIAPDCLDYQIPKLMIQPFIENAFFHAFNEKQGGHIYIMVAQEGAALRCEVVDNGDGMKTDGVSGLPKQASKRQLFSGIGVRNVNDRIKLLFGEEYGVTIASERGEGTKVKIRIPLLSPKNDSNS
ncbi:sensor histidine kinase [Paenibacillus sp. NEAU-GSW1]|uniref:cache domain-containing sensor histidine kinase n=1 Tax=Paenibacillus sp. NEAU-GSW1 TaxID=2682486 RepID=UPI0012E22908|nr:sensor histidine kinase [Paenibacillus sp. NEAU-GSW1]MUT65202.1 HAMP domain-containing protein [Paenibacillus sp. NEAU-GSW1]